MDNNNNKKDSFLEGLDNISLRFASIFSKIPGLDDVLGLDNLGEVCKDTITRVSDEFLEKGINLFDNSSYLKEAISYRIMDLLDIGLDLLETILLGSRDLTKIALMPRGDIVASNGFEMIVPEYYKISSLIENFSLEKDFEETLINFYNNNIYWIFTPGEFNKMLIEDELMCNKLGLGNKFKAIKPTLEEIVKHQEENTKNYKMNPSKKEIITFTKYKKESQEIIANFNQFIKDMMESYDLKPHNPYKI